MGGLAHQRPPWWRECLNFKVWTKPRTLHLLHFYKFYFVCSVRGICDEPKWRCWPVVAPASDTRWHCVHIIRVKSYQIFLMDCLKTSSWWNMKTSGVSNRQGFHMKGTRTIESRRKRKCVASYLHTNNLLNRIHCFHRKLIMRERNNYRINFWAIPMQLHYTKSSRNSPGCNNTV